MWAYNGEIDQDGLACGEGVATSAENPAQKYIGTFNKDEIHGICKLND